MAIYTESNDIIDGSFSVEITPNDILTRIRYNHTYNFTKSYFQDAGVVYSAALAAFYLKDYSEDFEMDWVRDEATALDMSERRLQYRKELQTHVYFSVPLYGLDDDILSDIEVTHEAGPDLGDVTILGMDLDLDNFKVKIKAIALPSAVTTKILKEDFDSLLLENGTDFLIKE